MRQLVTATFLSLDGVMQAPGGPEEDETGNFKSGGWSVSYFDNEVGQAMDEIFDAKKPDLLLGRKTYEIFASYFPHSSEPNAAILNNAKKYVVSRTLDKVEWANSVLVKGDVVAEIAKLKTLDGPELQVSGSGNLIQTLLKHHLIDVMHLLIFPVTVGNGKRLFAEGTMPAGFKLINSKVASSGVIIASYAHAGELKTGTMG